MNTDKGKQTKTTAAPSLEVRMLSLAKKFPNGVSADIMQKELKCTQQEQVQAINHLLQMGRLSVFQDGDALIYKAVSDDIAAKFKGLGQEEMLIYQLIEQSGNVGIWNRELKSKSNLQQPQIAKILKTLESRKLIKPVTSVSGKNKKVYMLYNLEPSTDITGGPWYNNGEFDVPFIEILHDRCYKYILAKKMASTEQISEYIRASGICTVDLRVEDMQNIVDTLIYDGLIEEVDDVSMAMGNTVVYKVTGVPTPHNAFTDIPCGVCPVFDDCHPGNDISPETCVYYAKWLEF